MLTARPKGVPAPGPLTAGRAQERPFGGQGRSLTPQFRTAATSCVRAAGKVWGPAQPGGEPLTLTRGHPYPACRDQPASVCYCSLKLRKLEGINLLKM